MTLVLSAPGMLWVFLAVPVALFLALLMRRETRVAVACMRPWRAVLALPRPRPQRNPFDLEILCITLATALTAFALCQPVLQAPLRDARRVHIVLDDSIRMQARHPDGTTRWTHAREAWERLAAAHPDAEASLFLTSENRPRTVRERLANLPFPAHPSTNPPDPAQRRAFLTAVLEAAAQEDAAVVWIGDADPDVEDGRLEVIRVGVAVPNRAILEAAWIQTDPPTVFLAVGNFSDTPQDGTLRFSQDGTELLRLPVSLDPHATTGETHTLPETLHPGIPLSIQLLPDDDAIHGDNTATLPPLSTCHVRVPEGVPPRVGLALEAAGLVPVPARSEEATPSLFEVVQDGDVTGSPEVVLLVAPTRAAHGLLSHGSPKPIRAARIRGGDGALPAVSGDGLAGAEVPTVQLPPGSRVHLEVVTGDGTVEPWIASWPWEGRTVLYIAGLPDAWTERAAFPVAIASLLAPHLPPTSPLPGAAGSDTTQADPTPPHTPELQAGEPPLWEMPLTRIATLLAFGMFLLPLLREFGRIRTRRTAA